MIPRSLEREFDLEAYLKEKDPLAMVYGEEYAMTCPQCGKDQKLWVRLKEKRVSGTVKRAGTFICYYCDMGGEGPAQLVRWCEESPNDFAVCEVLRSFAIDADSRVWSLRKLATEALKTVEKSVDLASPTIALPSVPLPRSFVTFDDTSVDPVIRGHALDYLLSRNLTIEQARKYKLGYCADPEAFFFGRMIVPIFQAGKRVSFVARYMKKTPPEGVKKTRYPKGSKTGAMLPGFKAARNKRVITLVEDVFSRMRLGAGTLATLGTTISVYQLEMLLTTEAEELHMLWDRDAMVRHATPCPKIQAGGRCPACKRHAKTWRYIDMLSEFFKVKPLILPDSRDPDEHTPEFIDSLRESTPFHSTSAWRDAARSRIASL